MRKMHNVCFSSVFAIFILFSLNRFARAEVSAAQTSDKQVTEITVNDDLEQLIKEARPGSQGDRRTAIVKLGQKKDARAIDVLVEVLNDPGIKNTETQEQVIYALENIGDPRCVEPLISHLDDDNNGIRNSIILALDKLKDPRSVEPLIRILEESNKNDPDSKQLNPHIAPLLKELTKRDFGTDAAKWREWWKESQDPQKAAEIDRRKKQIRELGEKKEVVQIPLLTEALKDRNADIRTSASWALASMVDKAAFSALVSALQDEDYRVRANAVEGLRAIGGDEVIDPLIEMLKDTSPEVRNNLIFAFVSIGKNIVPALLKKMHRETSKIKIFAYI